MSDVGVFVGVGVGLVFLQVVAFFANLDKAGYSSRSGGLVKFFMYLFDLIIFCLLVFVAASELVFVKFCIVVGSAWFLLFFHFLLDEYGKLEKNLNLVASLLLTAVMWVVIYITLM